MTGCVSKMICAGEYHGFNAKDVAGLPAPAFAGRQAGMTVTIKKEACCYRGRFIYAFGLAGIRFWRSRSNDYIQCETVSVWWESTRYKLVLAGLSARPVRRVNSYWHKIKMDVSANECTGSRIKCGMTGGVSKMIREGEYHGFNAKDVAGLPAPRIRRDRQTLLAWQAGMTGVISM